MYQPADARKCKTYLNLPEANYYLFPSKHKTFVYRRWPNIRATVNNVLSPKLNKNEMKLSQFVRMFVLRGGSLALTTRSFLYARGRIFFYRWISFSLY